MAPFYPVYALRSDGTTVTVTRGKKERNEPTPEQLDTSPDSKGICDYYRLLGPDDAKHLDWRRKIGTMLIRQIGTKEQAEADYGYMLYDLPENYRLYEHIKSKVKSEGSEDATKSAKNHSGGGHDRQDAYLYGHPLGRKKRFRSPADFFPHVLWLVTDKTGNTENCTCKICSPDEFQFDEPQPGLARKVSSDATNIKRSASSGTTSIPTSVAQTTAPKSTPLQTQLSSARPKIGSPAVAKAAPASTTISQYQIPQPLPLPTSLDHQLDMEYNDFIYRQGELVWFDYGAWRLGVCLRRFRLTTGAQTSLRAYVIQPLSHPYNHQAPVMITNDLALRPWLKLSAPGLMNKFLADSRNVTFDNTDWHAYMNGAFGPTDHIGIDACILAALAIDASYTLFNPISVKTIDQNVQERRFAGIFFGGEKIWQGDPVRLHTKSGQYVLVLHHIIEHRQVIAGPPPQQTSSVTLVGDTFRLAEVVNPATDASPAIGVPARMLSDIKARNKLTPSSPMFWKFLGAQGRYSLASIRGRWYEASVHGQRIDPAQLKQGVEKGRIGEACDNWNGRGDGQRNDDRRDAMTQRSSRVDAFGRAVPPGTVVVDGLEEPSTQEVQALMQPGVVFAAQQQQQAQAQQQQVQREQQQQQQQQQQARADVPMANQDADPQPLEDTFLNLDGASGGTYQAPPYGGARQDGPRGFYG